MSVKSHAMVAKHLAKINQNFENGIVYHYTKPEQVEEIKDLVKRAAEPLDYGLPTSGTAHLRLNVIVKKTPDKLSWQYSGSCLTSPDLDLLVEQAKAVALANNPNNKIQSESLQCYILNEWERYSVVFELQINLEDA